MRLSERLSSAREKYAKFANETARTLYKRTIQIRELPDGRCQVIRFIDKEEWERPGIKYEAGALIIAEGKSWKELGL